MVIIWKISYFYFYFFATGTLIIKRTQIETQKLLSVYYSKYSLNILCKYERKNQGAFFTYFHF